MSFSQHSLCCHALLMLDEVTKNGGKRAATQLLDNFLNFSVISFFVDKILDILPVCALKKKSLNKNHGRGLEGKFLFNLCTH